MREIIPGREAMASCAITVYCFLVQAAVAQQIILEPIKADNSNGPIHKQAASQGKPYDPRHCQGSHTVPELP